MKIAIINSSPEVYNLATHRIARFHELLGDEVAIASGGLFLPEVWEAKKLYFSCIFTWDLPRMVERINLFKQHGVEIEIGGPAATAMPLWIENQTGIKPHAGLDNRFEHIKGDFKMSFTSRGCRNNCPWCIVPRIESEPIEYNDFNIPVGENPYIGDNNLLMTSWEHQQSVVERLKNVRNLDINSGMEAALFTEETYQLYSKLHLERWRLAFDSLDVEKEIERASAILRSHDVRYSNISTFVLIGFPGTTMEENIYRLEKTRALGMTPYPQRYVPLNSLVHKYTAKGFDNNELEKLRCYWVSANIWRSCSWDEYQKQYKPLIENGTSPMLWDSQGGETNRSAS
jgi:hypothetical protein